MHKYVFGNDKNIQKFNMYFDNNFPSFLPYNYITKYIYFLLKTNVYNHVYVAMILADTTYIDILGIGALTKKLKDNNKKISYDDMIRNCNSDYFHNIYINKFTEFDKLSVEQMLRCCINFSFEDNEEKVLEIMHYMCHENIYLHMDKLIFHHDLTDYLFEKYKEKILSDPYLCHQIYNKALYAKKIDLLEILLENKYQPASEDYLKLGDANCFGVFDDYNNYMDVDTIKKYAITTLQSHADYIGKKETTYTMLNNIIGNILDHIQIFTIYKNDDTKLDTLKNNLLTEFEKVILADNIINILFYVETKKPQIDLETIMLITDHTKRLAIYEYYNNSLKK